MSIQDQIAIFLIIMGVPVFLILCQISCFLSWLNNFVRNDFTTGVITQAVEEALREDLCQGL